MLTRILMILGGILSLALGTLGIFVPGLPTTVFVLIAAWLFVRSSPRLYGRLMASRLYGRYLRRWQEAKGMTRGEKRTALIMMWVMISISIALIEMTAVRIITAALGLVGTISILIVRTVPAAIGAESDVEE